MRPWRIGLCALAVVAALVGLVLLRLQDQDLERRQSEAFEVTTQGNTLTGTLWLPDQPPHAALVLVHGDGPQDRTSGGGYASLINTLLDDGVAVAAWDKPGVGGSSGDWLAQSMADRAVETQAALAQMRARLGLPTGALGFSQAGWVLPHLTEADADFLVLVGAAVSWQEQGAYYTRTRLTRAGQSAAEVDAALAAEAKTNARLFGPEVTSYPANAPMGPARWRFIKRNHMVDARAHLEQQTVSLLALWGSEDLNVDAQKNAEIYRALGKEVIVMPAATHGLLKAPTYNSQLSSEWSLWTTMRFLWAGRRAYQEDSLSHILEWIRRR